MRSRSLPPRIPWPFHFAQLLAPKLSVTGYADGCMSTWPGYQRPEPSTLHTFTYRLDCTCRASTRTLTLTRTSRRITSPSA